MSKKRETVASDAAHSHPAVEPWLVACLLAFVPGLLIVILPRATLEQWLVPIIGSMCAFAAVGMVMLIRTELTRRSENDRVVDRHREAA